jgi:paired amphipathic helix protein Sin3a
MHSPPSARAFPENTLLTAEHTSASAEQSPHPLSTTGAYESRSIAHSPRPAAPPDDVQSTGAGDGGGSGSSVQPPQQPPPPPPPRQRSHDSLTGASVEPRSRATSVEPDPSPTENVSDNEIPAFPAASDSVQGDGSNDNQPLALEVALSYLDAIKTQFRDEPDVYNHFLDITKDFKNQMYVLPTIFSLPPFSSFPSLRISVYG